MDRMKRLHLDIKKWQQLCGGVVKKDLARERS